MDRDSLGLSIRGQCELLGVTRSTVYYEGVGETPANLRLLRLLDEQYLKCPFYGSRKMVVWLDRAHGWRVNRKRVQRLMRLLGLEAVYPRRRTTQPGNDAIYPYLLRDVPIERPDQVWSADITYLRMARGFMYLTAIIDWYSRQVLTWRLSNSLEGSFCEEALEQALAEGSPEIFNTDQGAQFTSLAFTGRLQAARVAISMDGRGRALDNVFSERFWRSLKYELIYLHEYVTVAELARALREYVRFFNYERPHQALEYRTPWEVYRGGLGKRRKRNEAPSKGMGDAVPQTPRDLSHRRQ